MHVRPIVLLLVLCVVQPSTAKAGGVIGELPKDGSWATYHFDLKIEPIAEATGTVTIRSVGTETVKEETCRWIEVRTVLEFSDRKDETLHKLLIPEKFFKPETSPLDHVVRGWSKQADDPPQKLTAAEVSSKNLDLGVTALLFAGPLAEMKKTATTRTVDYQNGRLTCEGITGRLTFAENDPNLKAVLNLTVWKSDKVPFGTATIDGNLELIPQQGPPVKIPFEMIVNNFGSDAKSSLPDHN